MNDNFQDALKVFIVSMIAIIIYTLLVYFAHGPTIGKKTAIEKGIIEYDNKRYKVVLSEEYTSEWIKILEEKKEEKKEEK